MNDPATRKAYDKLGKDSADLESLNRRIQKDSIYTLRLGLDEFYNGRFFVIGAKRRCSRGRVEKFPLHIEILPGSLPGDCLIFDGLADDDADLVIVLKRKKDVHAMRRFRRKGRDLFFTQEVSLIGALCGSAFCIEHLDGRELWVKHEPLPAFRSIGIIPSEGMPMLDGSRQGHLYINNDTNARKVGWMAAHGDSCAPDWQGGSASHKETVEYCRWCRKMSGNGSSNSKQIMIV